MRPQQTRRRKAIHSWKSARPILEEEGSQDINQSWPGHRMHLTAELAK